MGLEGGLIGSSEPSNDALAGESPDSKAAIIGCAFLAVPPSILIVLVFSDIRFGQLRLGYGAIVHS